MQRSHHLGSGPEMLNPGVPKETTQLLKSHVLWYLDTKPPQQDKETLFLFIAT